ncbi:hypothetical protein CJ030_MR3G012316 [Morella rubra]|uniref:Uncharacterized protein n=1 Tax=Morella rubra TaxID=262757 RepID=A0A6A1W9N6_9ROSI|nr:hypothetical protein CJ030_MR3G012316 [Morella rubra]
MDGDVIDLLWRLESEDAKIIDVYVEHSVDVPTLVPKQDVINYIRSQCPVEDSGGGVMGAEDSGQHGDSCNEGEYKVANDVGNEAGYKGDNGGENSEDNEGMEDEEVLLNDFELTFEEETDLYSEGGDKEVMESLKGASWFGTCVRDEEFDSESDIGSVDVESDALISASGNKNDEDAPAKRRYLEFPPNADMKHKIQLKTGLLFRG